MSGKSDTHNGIVLLPVQADAVPVTPELVNQLRDELLSRVDQAEASLARGDGIAITPASMRQLATDVKLRGRRVFRAEELSCSEPQSSALGIAFIGRSCPKSLPLV